MPVATGQGSCRRNEALSGQLPLSHALPRQRRKKLWWEFWLCLFDPAKPSLPLKRGKTHDHP